jgi:hypothetical protein
LKDLGTSGGENDVALERGVHGSFNQPLTTAVSTAFKCPNCNSTDLKRVCLIHAAGLYESRGRIGALLFGNGDAFFVGKYRGANQSLLSKMLVPPRKTPYVAPVILWVMGFFIVMAFAGRGKLSWMMGVLYGKVNSSAKDAYLCETLTSHTDSRPEVRPEAWLHALLSPVTCSL